MLDFGWRPARFRGAFANDHTVTMAYGVLPSRVIFFAASMTRLISGYRKIRATDESPLTSSRRRPSNPPAPHAQTPTEFEHVLQSVPTPAT